MTGPQQPPPLPPEDWATAEGTAAALYLTLIAAWLTSVTAATFPAPGVIDPFGIMSATSVWTRTVRDWIRRSVVPVLTSPYTYLFGSDRGTVLFDQRPFVDEYLRTVENLLSRVPEETFRRVQAIVQTASIDGTPIPKVAEQIRETLFDAGAPYWTNRAETIARTEIAESAQRRPVGLVRHLRCRERATPAQDVDRLRTTTGYDQRMLIPMARPYRSWNRSWSGSTPDRASPPCTPATRSYRRTCPSTAAATSRTPPTMSR